jgi:hypothetical protein
MKITRFLLSGLLALCVLISAGCAGQSKVTDYQGLTTPYGEPIAHLHVTRVALHLFGRWGMFGDASVSKTTGDFLRYARSLGATKVHIDHTERTHFWFSLPPFTWIITPVSSSVSGDALDKKPDVESTINRESADS